MKHIIELFPSRRQWNSWSLPSKLTVIGAYVGIIALVLTSLSFLKEYTHTEGVIDSEVDDKSEGESHVESPRLTVKATIRNYAGYAVNIGKVGQFYLELGGFCISPPKGALVCLNKMNNGIPVGLF